MSLDAERRLQIGDNIEVDIPGKRLVEDVKLLADETDTTEAKDAVLAVLAQDQIRAVGDVFAPNTVARGVTVFAVATLGALAAALTVVAVATKKAVAAAGGEHAVVAPLAVVAIMRAGVVLRSSVFVLQRLQRPFELTAFSRNFVAHINSSKQR